jgi:hypothetical protein
MRNIKKIYLSIVSVLFLIVVIGSVTFAAVRLATINNIDGLTLNASSGDELQLSTDGINFFTNLSKDQIDQTADGIKLNDVTSTDGINFRTGGLRGDGIAIPNEHYFTFDIWVRTVRNERDLFLINHISDQIEFNQQVQQGTYIISKGVAWRNSIQFFNGPNIEDFVDINTIQTYYAKNAVRLSVVELVDDKNPLDTRNQEDLRSFIFDPSGNPERGYGALFGAYSYFFQKTLIFQDVPTEIPQVSYRLSEMDPFNPYQALDNESLVATLHETTEVDENGKTYYQAKIRVNFGLKVGMQMHLMQSIKT